MDYLDSNPKILEWSSESVVIPYLKPTDNRIHRYFPDMWVKYEKDGKIIEELWEVKPKAQCQEPKVKKRITKRYLNEVLTYGINCAKWAAAEKFCEERGWTFRKITEDIIYPNKYQKRRSK